jgi:hypothetical protein
MKRLCGGEIRELEILSRPTFYCIEVRGGILTAGLGKVVGRSRVER